MLIKIKQKYVKRLLLYIIIDITETDIIFRFGVSDPSFVLVFLRLQLDTAEYMTVSAKLVRTLKRSIR